MVRAQRIRQGNANWQGASGMDGNGNMEWVILSGSSMSLAGVGVTPYTGLCAPFPAPHSLREPLPPPSGACPFNQLRPLPWLRSRFPLVLSPVASAL